MEISPSDGFGHSLDASDASSDEMVAVLAAVSVYLGSVHVVVRRLPPKSIWLRTTRLEAIGANASNRTRARGWS